MDYRQFNELLTEKGSDSKSGLALLQEFVREFPYCQSGHLLLTKSMHLQDHVRYDQQLKRTAIAVPDRVALFNLIHDSHRSASTSPFVVEEAGSAFRIADEEFPVSVTMYDALEESAFVISSQVTGSEKSSIPNSPAIHPAMDEEVPITVSAAYRLMGDRHEIVRRKLEELFRQPAAPSNDMTLPEPPLKPAAPDSTETDQPAYADDGAKDVFMYSEEVVKEEGFPFELLEMGHALEDSILKDLEKLPELSPEKAAPEARVAPVEMRPTAGSFVEWLQQSHHDGFGGFETIDAGPTADVVEVNIEAPKVADGGFVAGEMDPTDKREELLENRSSEAIIDQFIRTSPRIVPQPKAEFYSPAVQARKSLEEHEDLVSETLAGIYADQGNIQKARQSYERLILLHPEKKAYFAALIQNLQQHTGSDSEDL